MYFHSVHSNNFSKLHFSKRSWGGRTPNPYPLKKIPYIFYWPQDLFCSIYLPLAHKATFLFAHFFFPSKYFTQPLRVARTPWNAGGPYLLSRPDRPELSDEAHKSLRWSTPKLSPGPLFQSSVDSQHWSESLSPWATVFSSNITSPLTSLLCFFLFLIQPLLFWLLIPEEIQR